MDVRPTAYESGRLAAIADYPIMHKTENPHPVSMPAEREEWSNGYAEGFDWAASQPDVD